MLRRFDVHKASSVKEAVQLRQRFGEDAAIYAGGTELLLAMKMGVARWPHLIDVKPIASLNRPARESWGTRRKLTRVTVRAESNCC